MKILLRLFDSLGYFPQGKIQGWFPIKKLI